MSMIKRVLLSSFTAMICMTSLYASEKEVLSPDGRLKVVVSDEGGIPSYQVFYDGVTFIEKSPLGMKTTIGDFTSSLSLGSEIKETSIRKNYRLPNIKKSKVEYCSIHQKLFGYPSCNRLQLKLRSVHVPERQKVQSLSNHTEDA